jgi:hypothetical protein
MTAMEPRSRIAVDSVFLIRIALCGTSPLIWRRVLVPAEFTMAELHDVVQAAMGWKDSHLHGFYIDKQKYGIPDPDDARADNRALIDEKKACLANVLNKLAREQPTFMTSVTPGNTH